jgi:uncharacterized protein involved in outer membrane biogenesis
MKKLIKFLIVIAILLIITVVSLQFIVNRPFIKDKIKASAEKTIKRPVAIENLSVHFLKGFSLSLNNFYIYEQDKKTVFAGLKSLDIELKLVPLLSKKIDISAITINKPEITIIKYKDNKYNFSDITQTSSSQEKAAQPTVVPPAETKQQQVQQKTETFPSVLIGQVSINDASLTMKQEMQDGKFKEFSLTGLSLDIKDFSFDKPLNFNLTSNLNKTSSIKCKINTSSIQDITKKPNSAEFDIDGNIQKLNSSDLAGIISPETLKDVAFMDLGCTANIKGSIEKGLTIEGSISTAPISNNTALALNKAKIKCFAEQDKTQNNPNAKLLETIKLNGTIDADSISYKQNTLSNIHTAINGDKGTLLLKDISAVYSGGTIKGNTSINLISSPTPFTIDANIADIKIKDVMVANTGYDKLSGNFKADISLQGKGFDEQSINKNLSGKTDIIITDAVFSGKNIKKDILKAMENPLLAQAFPGIEKAKEQTKQQKDETKISNLTVKTTLGNAVCNVNTLTCATDSADLTGNGTINFDLNSNLKVQMLLSKEFTQMLLAAEAGKEKQLPSYLPQENGRVMLPATVTGSIKDPTIMPDLSILISSITKGSLQDSLGNALGGGKKESGEKTSNPLGNILGGGKAESGNKSSGTQNPLGNILGGGDSGQNNSGETKNNPLKIF